MRNKATNSIKSAKFKFSNNCFEKEKGNSKGIWKIIKSLTGANNRKPNTVKNKDSTTADQFNSHFASVAERLRSLLPSIPFDMTKLVHFVLSRKDLEVEFSIPLLSKGYIIDNLRALNPKKAMGVDKFSARILKIAAPVIAPFIAKLMNRSIESCVFPIRWKTAKVTPLFKSGDRDDLNNYRPISVLPILSKLLERHVHTNLYAYLSDNNLLYACQSGFRRHHGTDTALIKLVDELLLNLDKNRVSGLVLIDYCKAFDMVDHQILMSKLNAYGMCKNSARWFRSYLSGRQQLSR